MSLEKDLKTSISNSADGLTISDVVKMFPRTARRTLQRQLKVLVEHSYLLSDPNAQLLQQIAWNSYLAYGKARGK